MPRDFFLQIRQRGIRPLRLLALALLAFLPACKYDSADVEWTFPASGDGEVGVQSVIAIRLTNTMSPSDIENTLPENITVTGDQTSGEYSGMIVAANEDDVFDGQTVTEFQQGVSSPEELLEDPLEMSEVTEEAGDNTLVFLLDPTEQFKPGERITVTVSEDVTVLGVPFAQPYVFSFTVEGGGGRSEGELYVIETSPLQVSGDAGLRPPVIAVLSGNISAGSESDAISVRGSQSGSHSGGLVRLDQNEEETSLTYVLGATDSFIPGEEVSVAFTSAITGSGPDATALSPYQLTFQARPGLNEDSWEENRLDESLPAGLASGFVAMLAADFLPDSGTVELATFRPRLLTLHGSSGLRVTLTPDDDWSFIDAVAVDADGDGIVEIVAMLSGSDDPDPEAEEADDQLRLQEYRVDGFGNLSATDSSLDFSTLTEGGDDNRLYVADLDSDGVPEIVAIHAEGSYAAAELPAGLGDQFAGLIPDGIGDLAEEAGEQPTGHLTIFQLAQEVDIADILNPVVRLQFVPVRNPISGFEQSRKLQLVDLDNDGRLDLVSEASTGSLVLYRNQTTSAAPFSFRRVGALKGSDGDDYAPDAWVAFDIETDGDVDIVSWLGESSYLHANHYQALGDLAAAADSLGLEVNSGLLFDSERPAEDLDLLDGAVGRGDVLRASNVDGDEDGTADLVIAGVGDDERGRLRILRNHKTPPPEPPPGLPPGLSPPPPLPTFEELSIDPSQAGEISTLSLLDFNGDTGLDVAVGFDGVPLVYESNVDPLNAARVPGSSEFTLRTVTENGVAIAAGLEYVYLSSLSTDAKFGVEVYGHIEAYFSGYSIALEYERDKLTFDGFDSPPGFEQLAVFDPCPGSSADNSCSGFATVTMAYLQDVIGIPTEEVKLGTFWFIRDQVDGQAQTAIIFSTAPNAGEPISNTLAIVEEGITQTVPVATDDFIEFEVNPPPPEPLVISCQSNYDPDGANTDVLVLWSTERENLEYDCVRIEALDGDLQLLEVYESWNRGSKFLEFPDSEFLVENTNSRDVTIRVTAGTGGCTTDGVGFVAAEDDEVDNEVVEADCQAQLSRPRPMPVITGCSIGEGNAADRAEVTWEWDGGPEIIGFFVYVNGNPIPLGPEAREFENFNITSEGSILYEVSARFGPGDESERASCIGDEVLDEGCLATEEIENGSVEKTTSLPLLAIEWSWANGEAYRSLKAKLKFNGVYIFGEEGDLEENFSSLSDERVERFVWPDDARELLGFYPGEHPAYLPRGGAAEGIYELTLFADGTCLDVEGEPVISEFEAFELEGPPESEIDISIIPKGDDIQVVWNAPWSGYLGGDYSLELQLLRDGEEAGSQDVLNSDTEYVFRSVEPLVGNFAARLLLTAADGLATLEDISEVIPRVPVVKAGDIIMPVRCPLAQDPQADPCEETFDIPILATGLYGRVTEVQFDLVIPAALGINRINGEDQEDLDGTLSENGVSRTYSFFEKEALPVLSAGSYLDGSEVQLLNIEVSGSLPPIAGTYVVGVRNAKLKFSESAEVLEVDEEDGEISVARSFLETLIEPDAVDPTVYDVTVRGSLRAPDVAEGVELNYLFNAFNIHLVFNPEHLELLPVPSQEGTIVWPLNEDGEPEEVGTSFLPTPDILGEVNSTGDLRFGWISFNFSSPNALQYLSPFEEEAVLKFRFRSLVPEDAPMTSTTISFVDGSMVDDEQPTAFFPEQAVPGVLVIDGLLDGHRDLGGEAAPLNLASISPATGPFDGGNQVRLNGSNLGEENPTIRLIPNHESFAPLPVTVDSQSSTELSFHVPALQVVEGESFPNVGSVTCDVELEVAGQLAVLEDAYTFEAPSLAGVDTSTVKACDIIRLDGTGLSARTTAWLLDADDVEDAGARVLLCHYRSSGDGRSLHVQVPQDGLPGAWMEGSRRLRLEVEFRPVVGGNPEYSLLPGPLLFLDLPGACPLACEEPKEEVVLFIRGDVNGDGEVTQKDSQEILDLLFSPDHIIGCMDAADVDDSGRVNITDFGYLLEYLNNEHDIPAPFPSAGVDPTPDDLGCEVGN